MGLLLAFVRIFPHIQQMALRHLLATIEHCCTSRLHLDPNILIKLTSLRRIRSLEAMCDDDARFVYAPRHCASVVQGLLLECECKHGAGNTLLWAGYSGWLLYTAASARGASFV
ncbi:serine/threonine-protein phosphatase 6 regulatory ankyrin repeat subunit A [Hordeum vulgare]|nr:serine/threonine-protein phosphatase 6 regulatory ankyrin repeat subunit A [Hordeum vulgare]